MSRYKAFTEAGFSDKGTRNTIDVEASKLANTPKIARRLQYLRDQVAGDAIMEVQERQTRLTELARLPIKISPTAKESTLAIAELNKMTGSYAPSKQAFIGEITLRIVHDVDRTDHPGTDNPTSDTPPELRPPPDLV
ncbi:hypothetical protein ACFLTP_03440 [Chloroflexota bacterium]